MENTFEIKTFNQRFLSGDPDEPCSHSQLFIRVNNFIICNEDDGDWVINEAALSLMRSVRYGYPNSNILPPNYYSKGITEDALINCCSAYMLFCASSMKWDVTLLDDDRVELSNFTKNEQNIDPQLQLTLSYREYAKTIYEFAIDSYRFFINNNRIVKSSWEQFEGQIKHFWNEYEEHLQYIKSNVLV